MTLIDEIQIAITGEPAEDTPELDDAMERAREAAEAAVQAELQRYGWKVAAEFV